MADLVVRGLDAELLKNARRLAFERGVTLKHLVTEYLRYLAGLQRLGEVAKVTSHETNTDQAKPQSVGAAVQPDGAPGRGSGGVEGSPRTDGGFLELAGIKNRYLTNEQFHRLSPTDKLHAIKEGRAK